MISLQKVNKYFNRRKSNEIHVINNTSLDLPDSGIVTILGPSGCGKTTLLNAIGGLDRVSSGKIIVDGDKITHVPSGRKDKIRNAKIGYIFQNFNLIDNKTVFENVAVALRMVGIRDKKIIKERVNYCLEAVGIYQFRNKTADALSGGQRQRVAIARAIVKNPRIIIADEPTGNLDSVNTLEVMNIIKTISKDRLVLLVTHERKIAEFYSERIIEMKDGVVISDQANDSSKFLDYQLENKIYLQDMPYANRFSKGDVEVDLFSDEDQPAGIKMAIRGGNLYINTGGKFNVIDENSSIELIDDHYSMIDESIYADHSFQYDKYLPENFKARYRSIYTPFNMLFNGFKNIANFNLIKKLLLLGFVFASAFMLMAVSNVLGVLDIKEEDFLKTDAHYITVSNPSRGDEVIKNVESMDSCVYAIPGDSLIQMNVPLGDFYQTSSAAMILNGSMGFTSVLSEDDIVYGRMPEKKNEIVVDKTIFTKFFDANAGKAIDLTKYEQFLDRRATVRNLPDFTIVGISETHAPTIFVDKSQCMFILTNATAGTTDFEYDPYSLSNGMWEDEGYGFGMEEEDVPILDVALAPKVFEIKYGRAPEEKYEVLMNVTHYTDPEDYDEESDEEIFRLDKEISVKVNGHKLKIVGFYKTDIETENLYVNSATMREKYVAGTKSFTVYAEDPEAMKEELDAKNLTSKINYDRDKESYEKEMRNEFTSSLIVAGLIVLVALIEMFLMLRSSFLSRIKEVGTLRAIGLKKRDIYNMFTGEILAITLLTAIPGIAIMYYLLYNLVKVTKYIEGQYMVTPMVAGIAFIAIIVFNLIVGLIPVFRTLRKTPAAILARTDI